MNKDGFRSFLAGKDIPKNKIDQFIKLAEKYETFTQTSGGSLPPGSSSGDIVRAFSVALIKENLNTEDNYNALAQYGRFLNDNDIYIAVVELVDGAEAMDNLYAKLGKAVGKQKRDRIFEGIELPPLGTPSTEKPQITQAVMERMERLVDPATRQSILSSCLRDLGTGRAAENRKKYLKCADFDEFLKRKGEDFIASLERFRDNNELYFTQPIDDDVIEFVRSQPEIREGVRDGNILYEAKIPYMTREWLAETDEKLKRYYYCHCPWVRESIRTGDVAVPASFCNCSAGFHKKYWEGVLDQPLKAEIVETVLDGDKWCKVAIHLPDNCVNHK